MSDWGIQPIGYRLVVKPLEVDKKTKGGIIIPDEAEDQARYRQSRGTVMAVGELAFTVGVPATEGHYSYKCKPKAGDVVRYREYAGLNYKNDDDVKYCLLEDSDILAIEEVK